MRNRKKEEKSRECAIEKKKMKGQENVQSKKRREIERILLPGLESINKSKVPSRKF